jgi:hypothetical protein
MGGYGGRDRVGVGTWFEFFLTEQLPRGFAMYEPGPVSLPRVFGNGGFSRGGDLTRPKMEVKEKGDGRLQHSRTSS